MTLADDYAASYDPRIIAQVTAAINNYCTTVAGEANTVAGHALRLTLATDIVRGQVPIQPLITEVCCFAHLTANSAAPSSDTTVQNAVAASWNLWAGVSL